MCMPMCVYLVPIALPVGTFFTNDEMMMRTMMGMKW